MGVRISSIFLPVDVEAIMRIRVPERIMNDQIAWHYEKSGQFSVKSAYKLALKLQSQDQMASSSNPKQREKLCKGMPRISRRTGCKVFTVILHISLYQEVLLGLYLNKSTSVIICATRFQNKLAEGQRYFS